MVQKTLRTMQDDIKEAREKMKKPVFGFMKRKEEARTEVEKTEEKPNADIAETGIQKTATIIPPEKVQNQKIQTAEVSPLKPETISQEEKTETGIMIPPKAEIINITETPKEENTTKTKQEEDKPVNFETVIKTTEENRGGGNAIKTPEKNRELESLTQRISGAMHSQTMPSTNPEKAEEPQEKESVPLSDKDSELKELISRMSNNLKETNEELQGLTEQLAESELVIEKLQAQSLNNINQKVENSSIGISQRPKDVSVGIYEKPVEEKGQNRVEIQPTKIIEPAEKVLTEEKPPNKANETETPYWSKLHQALKNSPEEENKPKPQIAKPVIKEEDNHKPQVIKEEEEKTEAGGIITLPQTENLEEIEEEKTEVNIPKTKIPNFYDNYINPENRLVFGKQEYYSSIHKKIKPKAKKENLEQFKDTFKAAEKLNLMTEAEEKMKLRRRIAKKYGLNLDALPWKKIIIGSILFLTIWGVTFTYITKKVQPPAPEVIVATPGKSIEAIDEKIKQEVTATQSQVSGINYFDAVLEPWKDFANSTTTRIRIVQNDNEIILTRDEALKTILGDENFNNIPQDFIDLVGDGYSVLVFKNDDDIRLGIALSFDQSKEKEIEEAMIRWEQSGTKRQRIYNVMKALFVKTKTTETEQNYFDSANYRGINLKYINIPDTNTSMDYFILEDMVIFTTSKETAIAMIDFLKK